MESKIIYQDKQIVVLGKPAGLVVNRAQTTKGKETLQDWIEGKNVIANFSSHNRRLKSASTFWNHSGIVHRLDKETSGLIIIAKTPEAFVCLQKQFKERSVVKKYLALLHGKLVPLVGDIRLPIKRNPQNRFRFGVFVDGRSAITNYKVKAYYQNPRQKNKSKRYFSLVEVEPKTGRTHQIRVHFADLRHPVVSDDLYAGRKTSRSDRGWCRRLFLHATFLEITHPKTEKRINFISSLPIDLKLALEKIEKIAI